MNSALKEQYLTWILDTQRPFIVAQASVCNALTNWDELSLDELVVESRMPVRTALLILHHLSESGKVGTRSPGKLALNTKSIMQKSNVGKLDAEHKPGREMLAPWYRQYKSLTSSREEPGLLWGQRRLIPDSAVDRAAFVLRLSTKFSPRGTILFLGDDDLVSPLVAVSTGWNVLVFDIDKEVLDRAQTVSQDLGISLSTRHVDLSHKADLLSGESDIVVCDPFPSADGSFESMFWLQAIRCLRRGGILVTTIAPSHKSEEYARGALSLLGHLGLQLIDLKSDFGRYEIFDFELVQVERELMGRLGVEATVSHTKSLLAARYLGQGDPGMEQSVNFARWSDAARSHYLTLQAGLSQQVELARHRGVSQSTGETNPDCIAPMLSEVYGYQSSEGRARLLSDAFKAQSGISSKTNVDSSVSVQIGGSYLNDSSGWIELALRAIESWERRRFDD
jgi:predicted methyltransferase